MKSLTIVIPIHIYNDKAEKYLTNALISVKELDGAGKNKISFVGPQDVIEKAEKLCIKIGCPQSVSLVKNDNVDVSAQINAAAFSCTTKYFSILEYDDTYNSFWFKCVDEYIDSNELYSAYMPLVNTKNEEGQITGTMNEIAWAYGFAERDRFGFISMEGLEVFMDFVLSGSVFKTEDFLSVGGLKPSLKIAAWYEFLLRMCYNQKSVYVIPRLGYNHTIRKDSYSGEMSEKLPQEEGAWLVKTAKQEYFFKEDRNKTYENTEGEQ